MEVIINGIKYIPETDKTVEVNGNLYESITNWLFNVRCKLIEEWIVTVKAGESANDTPGERALFDKINCFDEYTKEFLGFEYNEDYHVFVEVKK